MNIIINGVNYKKTTGQFKLLSCLTHVDLTAEILIIRCNSQPKLNNCNKFCFHIQCDRKFSERLNIFQTIRHKTV